MTKKKMKVKLPPDIYYYLYLVNLSTDGCATLHDALCRDLRVWETEEFQNSLLTTDFLCIAISDIIGCGIYGNMVLAQVMPLIEPGD